MSLGITDALIGNKNDGKSSVKTVRNDTECVLFDSAAGHDPRRGQRSLGMFAWLRLAIRSVGATD